MYISNFATTHLHLLDWMVNWAIHEGIMIALYSIGGENCEAEADIELYKTRHLPNKHTTQDLAPYELESYKNA